MKRCPKCSHVYADDMSFCLSDGTPLVALLDDPDEPTVVRPLRKEAVTQPAAASGLWLKILAAVVVLFFGLIVVAGVAAWILWPRDVVVVPNGNNSNVLTPTPTPIRTLTPVPTATGSGIVDTEREKLEQERTRLEEERRRLEEEKRRPPATPDPPPRVNDPGTARISFRRGGIGETVSGLIGRQRSYVLRTLNGQYLSASVHSTDGCVTFTDGGSSTGYPTRSGDSFLHLRNNCSEPVRFRMSVTVK
jgi:hypothetical protein